jgi:hypothetical protein
MEPDHILIARHNGGEPEVFAKITDGDSYNAFVDMFNASDDSSIMCSSSMNHPFDSTTNLSLVLLANNISGNRIESPDRYYQPVPGVRDDNGILPNQFWIMESNGLKAFPDIEKDLWLCYYEEEIGEGVTVQLMDAIPSTLEIVTYEHDTTE